MSELKVLNVPIDSIHPDPENPRLHNTANLEAIAASLREMGQRTPIVIGHRGNGFQGKNILKGNGTWESARTILKWPRIKVVRFPFTDRAREVAYMIADNKTGDLSEFDWERTTALFEMLQGESIDLSITGFQSFEIEPLLQAFDPMTEKPDDLGDSLQKMRTVKLTVKAFEALERARHALGNLSPSDTILRLVGQHVGTAHKHAVRRAPSNTKRRHVHGNLFGTD